MTVVFMHCNRTGTCKNCVCVKAGRHCFSCRPRKLGKCANNATLIGALLQAARLQTVLRGYPSSVAPSLPVTTTTITTPSSHLLYPFTQPSSSSTGSLPRPPVLSSSQPAFTSAPAQQAPHPCHPVFLPPGLSAATSSLLIHPSTQPPPHQQALLHVLLPSHLLNLSPLPSSCPLLLCHPAFPKPSNRPHR